jgi:hypothetical protein
MGIIVVFVIWQFRQEFEFKNGKIKMIVYNNNKVVGYFNKENSNEETFKS